LRILRICHALPRRTLCAPVLAHDLGEKTKETGAQRYPGFCRASVMYLSGTNAVFSPSQFLTDVGKVTSRSAWLFSYRWGEYKANPGREALLTTGQMEALLLSFVFPSTCDASRRIRPPAVFLISFPWHEAGVTLRTRVTSAQLRARLNARPIPFNDIGIQGECKLLQRLKGAHATGSASCLEHIQR
jgi:hypothetical protein